ncbi:hypothetical protein Tco_0931175 [Tanacetum coccineum]
MSNIKFADTHNLVAFLSKPAKSKGFEQIMDFLNAQPIRHALTVNHPIYTSCIEQFWDTVKVKTVNGEVQLHALVDGKKIIINESTVRRDIHLEDTEDEAVYKELGDSLVRAATTASSLETECQETIGDTIAQTGFESVSKHSNDSLFARCNTLRSDKDRLKLNELMELCTNLQQRVLDFEKTKTTQANEIDSLKRRVKKLEKKDRDEENLGEDASKQGMRINAIDADEDIILVNVQDDAGRFDVNTLTGDEVFAEQEVAAKDVNLTIDEVTLAQALTTLKSVKPKVKGTDIAKITRKRAKPDKHEHGNG